MSYTIFDTIRYVTLAGADPTSMTVEASGVDAADQPASASVSVDVSDLSALNAGSGGGVDAESTLANAQSLKVTTNSSELELSVAISFVPLAQPVAAGFGTLVVMGWNGLLAVAAYPGGGVNWSGGGAAAAFGEPIGNQPRDDTSVFLKLLYGNVSGTPQTSATCTAIQGAYVDKNDPPTQAFDLATVNEGSAGWTMSQENAVYSFDVETQPSALSLDAATTPQAPLLALLTTDGGLALVPFMSEAGGFCQLQSGMTAVDPGFFAS